MKPIPMRDLQTERLVLRKIRLSDLDRYHRHLTSDSEVAKYMLWQSCDDIAHTEANLRRILRGYEDGTRYHWAIARREDDALLGTIALFPGEGEFGFAYMLGRAFQGRGYGTEALRAVLSFAFEEMDAKAVSADHFAENPASGAVMAKVGMVKTAYLPGKYEKDGIFHDAILYRITKEQWAVGQKS